MSQETSLPVINFDRLMNRSDVSTPSRHGVLFPSSLRCICIGASNSGKTNSVLSMLLHPNGLRYANIYVYSKSLHQPKYKFLSEVIDPIEEVNLYTFSDCETVIAPDEAKSNSIFVFDDLATVKQTHVRNFFFRGRHFKIDSVLLSQSYAQICKHLVRDNCNILIIFRQDQKNLRHIYMDHIGSDFTFNTFNKICEHCWSEKYGFLVIVKDDELNRGRYRKGFDKFININDFTQ